MLDKPDVMFLEMMKWSAKARATLAEAEARQVVWEEEQEKKRIAGLKRDLSVSPLVKSFRKSQDSKQSWITNRFRHMQSIYKFHNSFEGNRFHMMLNRFNNFRKDLMPKQSTIFNQDLLPKGLMSQLKD